MKQNNRIILAPMEGVLDYQVRQILTEINQFDYCVTEFVRVTHHQLSNRTFYHHYKVQDKGDKRCGWIIDDA